MAMATEKERLPRLNLVLVRVCVCVCAVQAHMHERMHTQFLASNFKHLSLSSVVLAWNGSSSMFPPHVLVIPQ